MKKKFVSIVLAALMVVTMTAGCGESEQKSSDRKSSKDSNSEIENQTGNGSIDDAQNESETSKDTPKQVLTLDYDELNAWINGGFMGTSPSGKEVHLGLNAEWNYGILIVTDDSDMTVFGYEGAYKYSYDDSIEYGYITIADQAFGYKELPDGELEIDMGDDLGVTRVANQTKPVLMKRIEEIIEKYTLAD